MSFTSRNGWPKLFIMFYTIFGSLLTSIEFCSYLILFYHIHNHNNNIINGILDQKVIQSRNRANAMSLTGLFMCWMLEVWYIILVGFLSFILGNKSNRGISAFLRYYEFLLIPLIHVHTSEPVKRFKSAMETKKYSKCT